MRGGRLAARVVALALAGLSLPGSGAIRPTAGQPASTETSLSPDARVVQPGQALTLTVQGSPGQRAAIAASRAGAGAAFRGQPLLLGPDLGQVATGTLDPSGRFVVTVAIPTDLPDATYYLQAATAADPGFQQSLTLTNGLTVTVAGAAFLQKPFAGEFDLLQYFDHDAPEVPERFTGEPALAFWGERTRAFAHTHVGYDWRLPEGTPLVAAAAGRVEVAGEGRTETCNLSPPCPAGGVPCQAPRTYVRIYHAAVAGVTYATEYVHMSRMDVTTGSQVTAGQPIGQSGNIGCSTTPHLHLTTYRLGPRGELTFVDPYGWDPGTGQAVDPWAARPDGAVSRWLWREPPEIFMYARTALGTFSIGITAVRYMGPRDADNPNNEFVQIEASAPTDLTGYRLRNIAGDTYTFPPGFVLQGIVRVYSGPGRNTSATLYWGRTAGVWNNEQDCAVLFDARGRRVWRLFWGTNTDPCPTSLN